MSRGIGTEYTSTRSVTDSTPEHSFPKGDFLQSCLLHHFYDFPAGEPLFQARAKAIQSVITHHVEAAFPIGREREGLHVEAKRLQQSQNARQRPVNKDRNDIAKRGLERERQVTDESPDDIRYFPNSPEPPRSIIERIVEV